MCARLCVRELQRIVKEQEEKKHQEEMKRWREDELKKKSEKGGKNDTKEESRKMSLLEGEQVCIFIPFQHSLMNQNTLRLSLTHTNTHLQENYIQLHVII